MSKSRDILDFILYILLFGTTVFINKYVLTVLGFTYPTIYQGWQTLIGGLLLRLILFKSSWLSVSPTPLDRSGFISLLPSFLFFVAGIVASSKALADLSIAMFLCLHNTLSSVLYLMEVFPTIKKPGFSSDMPSYPVTPFNKIGTLAAILTVFTALIAIIDDLDMTFSDSPYFWLMVSLSCVAVQKLHSRIADARYTEIDRLYCCYVFSVIVLAPASLYLEEAFEVLHFPHASRLDFMAACIGVGVTALLLGVHSVKVQQLPQFNKVDAVSKLLTSLVSVIVFPDFTSTTVKVLVLTNLTLGVLVPQSKVTQSPDDDPRNWNDAFDSTSPDTESLLSTVQTS